MNYYEYQKALFEHLWSRHEKDPSFKFSVRQKASKGAERNHFIGTENSGYFGFTLWDIPIYYPGSAADLTDFMFRGQDNNLSFRFEFGTLKSATGEQSEGDLEFGYELLKEFEKAGISFTKNPDGNKMLYFFIDPDTGPLDNVTSLLQSFDSLYEKIAPIIDRTIENIKQRRPTWQAGRFSNEKFSTLIGKMHERIRINSQEKPLVDQKPPTGEIMIVDPEETFPRNLILYGPPGTGKTYTTIDKAIQIIDPNFYYNNKNNRTGLNDKFRSLLIHDWNDAKGQIAFVTFHQSMSYEDFVEGIKPSTPKPGEPLSYDIEDGIFKLLCKLARSNFESTQKDTRLLPFEQAFEIFKEEWEEDREQKFPLKTQGYDYTIIGFTNTSIQFRKASGGTGHTLSITTLKEQYYGKEYDFKQGVGIYYPPILNKLKSYSSGQNKRVEPLNYVLIVDEINRGNVSQILGELITLIEEDKRIGKRESLEIMLPYSKESFGVPANVYIIGTMNTADRSVEALDTALRRRFSFEEMLPKPELLSPKQMLCSFWNLPEYIDLEWETWNKDPFLEISNSFYELIGLTKEQEEKILDQDLNDEQSDRLEWMITDLDIIEDESISGVNLQRLLETINARLEKLVSKDYQIGHAFFINNSSVGDFYNSFYQKLIPQLQEYFYGDFGKIGLILGKDFIKLVEDSPKIKFAAFPYDDVESLLDKPIYRVNDFRSEGLPEYESFLLAARNIYQ